MSVPAHQRGGFTMVEVMISLMVITIGLMSVFGAIGSAGQANTSTQTRNQMIATVDKIAERLQAASMVYPTMQTNLPTNTQYVYADGSSLDINATSTEPIPPGLTRWNASTPLITVRTKTTVSSVANLVPVVITARWMDGSIKQTSTYEYYYVLRN